MMDYDYDIMKLIQQRQQLQRDIQKAVEAIKDEDGDSQETTAKYLNTLKRELAVLEIQIAKLSQDES